MLFQGALFESPHSDENDIQTISHRCVVMSCKDFSKRRNQELGPNTYYQAGYYDPTINFIRVEPDALGNKAVL